MLARLIYASVICLIAALPAHAQTVDVSILIDDRDGVGCDVTPTGLPVISGVDARLTATVDRLAAQVINVDLSLCTGATFGPPSPVGGGQPVGNNNGLGGADVVEMSVLRATATPSSSGLQISALADNGAGVDTTGAGIFGAPLTAVPGLGVIGLFVLACLILALAWVALKRQRVLLSLLLVGLSFAVLAMNFMVDGQIGDWSSVPPVATDPAGDGTNGETAVDIVAVFAGQEDQGAGPELFFRVDMADLIINNQLPVPQDDVLVTDEDTAVAGDLFADNGNGVDADPDTDPFTVTMVDGTATVGAALALPSGAQVTVNADGTFAYDPLTTFNSLSQGQTTTDSFTYSIDDGIAGSGQATATVTITGVNDVGTALDDPAYATGEDTPLNQPAPGVLGNDTDPDTNDTLTAVLDTGPTNALSFSLNPDGSFSYTPALNFNGSDGFTYHFNDGFADSNIATATINVGGVNDPPVAVDDTGDATDEDTPINTQNVLTNDTDPDLDPLSVLSVDAVSAQGAAITDNSDGTFGYDPTVSATLNALSVGQMTTDTFSYTVTDGLLNDTATVSVDVTGVNDPMTANDDGGAGYATDEDSSFTTGNVLANDTDPDAGDALSVMTADATSAQSAAITDNGDGTFGYDPTGAAALQALATGAMVTDTFSYTATDGNGSTDPATVSIDVTGINDAPVIAFPTGGAVFDNISPVNLDLAATLTDVDSPDFDTGDLTVSLGLSADPSMCDVADVLTVENQGMGATQIGFDGVNVSYEGTQFGTVTTDYLCADLGGGLFDITPLLITFDPNASVAAVTALLRALQYTTGSADDQDREASAMVTDGDGGTSNAALTTVTVNLNQAPVITSDGGGATAAVNAAENQTAVTTVTATDADIPAQTLTFSISGGADQALFSIGAASGVLTFNSAPDFENPTDAGTNNVYDVQVTVTDDGTPNLSDIQDIAVTVTDVNEAPTITSDGGGATASVNAAENQTAVTTVTATDGDLPAQTLTFSISGGADQALFGIGAGSGVLTFNSAPDFENPIDAGTNNVYDVQVTVTDNGAPNLSDVQDIAVTVTSVNDAPVITSDGGGATATVNAAENQTAVTTVTATDGDLPAQTLTFSISGGADQALFGIGAGSGVLTFNSAPDFENPADAGANNVYDVQVTVTDNGAPNLTDVQDIAVTVTDVNDAPVITSDGGGATAAVNAAENQTAVTTVTATDEDLPAQTLTFSISGGVDQALFGIGAGSGVLTFNSAPDFENPIDAGTNNVYDVQVTVTDNGAPNLSDVQDLAVTVTDVNDAPVITSDGGGATAAVNAAENQTAVTTVTATDEDLPAQTLTFSITGGADQALFGIGAGSGVLTFNSALDFENPTDAGANNVYDVQVTVTDNGAPNLSDVQDLAVTVTDVNDAPLITSDGGGATAMVNAAENQTGVTTTTATDGDLPAQTLTFSISGGADQALFGIGAGTGVLTFNAPPNFEAPADAGANGVYDVQVTVTDNGAPNLTDVQDLAVTVVDVNDSPVITSDGGGATAMVSAAENQTGVTTVTAVDADLPAQTLTFSISGGADQALFGIVAATGVLTFNSAPNFEMPGDAGANGVYDVQVTVTDNGAPNLSDVQDIAVTVTDVNEPPTAMDEAFAVQSNVGIQPNAMNGLLSNDSDPEGSLMLAAGSVGTFATTAGGSITTAADGSFIYTPQAGDAAVADTFDYDIDDSVNPPVMATATFNVDANTIWFVDLDASGTEDGTLNAPFDSLSDLDNGGPDANGHTIFHYTSSMGAQTDALSDDFDLQASQFLIGEGATGAGTINTLRGFTTHPFSLTLPSIGAAANHTITSSANGGITLNTGNTIRGLDIGDTTGGTGLSGLNFGTLTIDDVSISGVGRILNLDTGTVTDPTGGDFTFGILATTSYSGNGIDLNAVGGGFTVDATTSITFPSGMGVTLGIDIDGSGGSFDFGATTIDSGTDAGIDIATSGTGTFTFDSLSITNDAGAGLRASTGGTINIAGTGSTIGSTNGPGIDLTSTTLGGGGATFASVSSSGSVEGINLDSVTGSLTINGGSITTSSGIAFDLNAGSSNVTYAGSITNTSGLSVEVTGRMGGTALFSGSVSGTGAGTGINLTSNGTGTITFGGGVTLSTSNTAAFNATGGGFVNVTGAGNTLTTTTGTALNVVSTDIGGSGLTFESISANGASSGIVLNSTGTSGSLTITGDGGNTRNASGGTIANTTSHGIDLNASDSFSATSMDLTSPGDGVLEHGINAVNITGSGGLFRAGRITNVISNGDGIRIVNTSTNLGLFEVRDSLFSGVSAAGNDGIFVNGLGNSVMRIDVVGTTKPTDASCSDTSNASVNQFDSLRGDGVQVNPEGTSLVTLNLRNSCFTTTQDNNSDVSRYTSLLAASGELRATIEDNLFQDTGTQPPTLPVDANVGVVDFVANDTSTLRGRLNTNFIEDIDLEVGTRHVGDDNAIEVDVVIDNNDINNIVDQEAILMYIRDATQLGNVSITNNGLGTGANGTVGGGDDQPIDEHGIEFRVQSRNTTNGGGPNPNTAIVTHTLISGNAIVNTDTGSEAIDLDAEVDNPDGSSANPATTFNSTVINNTLSNILDAEEEVAVDSEDGPAGGAGPSLLCVDLRSNTMTGGEIDQIDEDTGADLDMVQAAPSPAVNANEVDDANGLPCVGATCTNIDVIGAPNFAAVGSCTGPTHTMF